MTVRLVREKRALRRPNPMKLPIDLLDSPYEIHVEEAYDELPNGQREWDLRVLLIRSAKGTIAGEVTAYGVTGDAEEPPVFFVRMAKASDKFGPLLYDVAMEYAYNQSGGSVASDVVVSKWAYDVWQKYFHERKHDVSRAKLDTHIRKRTFGDISCYRDELEPKSVFVRFENKVSLVEEAKCWSDPDATPMRRRYWKRDPEFLDELEALGKIKYFGSHGSYWPDEMRYGSRGFSDRAPREDRWAVKTGRRSNMARTKWD